MAGEEIITYFYFLIAWFILSFILLLGTLLGTPAPQFLWAKARHRLITWHPMENRYTEAKSSKLYGSLAEIKNKGFYIIDPKDVFIEGKSKVPTAIVFGNTGHSIDISAAAYADAIKKLGYRYYEGLIASIEAFKKANPGATHIMISGESIEPSAIIEYFNTSDKSDLMEAEIQRRTAADIAKIKKAPGDTIKFMIGAAVALFILVIAYNALMLYSHPATTTAVQQPIIQQQGTGNPILDAGKNLGNQGQQQGTGIVVK